MLRKTALLFSLFIALSITSFAQNFAGIMEVKKQTGKDVVNYVYYVKGDKVRIDEFTPGTRTISGTFIMDTKANTMQWLDPVRKMTGKREVKAPSIASAGMVASTSKEMKELFGYKCTEQIVTNTTDTTAISYYIAPGKFAFFTPMMKMLNRQEKLYTYFFALTIKDGYMPLLAIEKNLKGEERGRLEVTRIEQKDITDGMFTVPSDYVEVGN